MLYKGFIIIDVCKNVMLVPAPDLHSFLEDNNLDYRKCVKDFVKQHNTKKELSDTITEYLKKGGIEINVDS